MTPIRILIAGQPPQAGQQLCAFLERETDLTVVGMADSSAETLSLTEQLQPDLLITEIALRGIDGLAILEQLPSVSAETKVIVLSNTIHEKTIRRALNAGAAFYMTRPCDLALLVNRIRSLCRPGKPAPEAHKTPAATHPQEDLLPRYVSHMLIRLAISPHLSGHRFLREAVILTAGDPLRFSHVSTELYPAVAQLFGTTPGRVERAIRFAITRSWEDGGSAAFSKLMDRSTPLTDKPSNRAYIALLAEHVRIQLPGAKK